MGLRSLVLLLGQLAMAEDAPKKRTFKKYSYRALLCVYVGGFRARFGSDFRWPRRFESFQSGAGSIISKLKQLIADNGLQRLKFPRYCPKQVTPASARQCQVVETYARSLGQTRDTT